MKYVLVVLHEVAYIKNETGEIVRKYFVPDGKFFVPNLKEFENLDEFIKLHKIKTIKCEALRKILDQTASDEF